MSISSRNTLRENKNKKNRKKISVNSFLTKKIRKMKKMMTLRLLWGKNLPKVHQERFLMKNFNQALVYKGSFIPKILQWFQQNKQKAKHFHHFYRGKVFINQIFNKDLTILGVEKVLKLNLWGLVSLTKWKSTELTSNLYQTVWRKSIVWLKRSKRKWIKRLPRRIKRNKARNLPRMSNLYPRGRIFRRPFTWIIILIDYLQQIEFIHIKFSWTVEKSLPLIDLHHQKVFGMQADSLVLPILFPAVKSLYPFRLVAKVSWSSFAAGIEAEPWNHFDLCLKVICWAFIFEKDTRALAVFQIIFEVAFLLNHLTTHPS